MLARRRALSAKQDSNAWETIVRPAQPTSGQKLETASASSSLLDTRVGTVLAFSPIAPLVNTLSTVPRTASPVRWVTTARQQPERH